MGQDQCSPGNSSEKQPQPQVETNADTLTRRDPKRLRELLTPLLDLGEDVDNLKNLDKMLADRFAQLTERRKQLQSMKNEDHREIVTKMLEEEEAKRARDCSPKTDGDIPTLSSPQK